MKLLYKLYDDGEIDKTKKLLKKMVKNQIYYNDYFMIILCKSGNLDMIKFLMKIRNKLTSNIITLEDLFITACKYRHLKIIKYFKYYGEKYNNKININWGFEYEIINKNIHEYKSIIVYLLYLSKHNYDFLFILYSSHFREYIEKHKKERKTYKLYHIKNTNKYNNIYISNNNLQKYLPCDYNGYTTPEDCIYILNYVVLIFNR